MKIVIDVDENVFTRLFDNGVDTSLEDRKAIDSAVRNGTLLPKGHGDLIDKSKIYKAIPAEEDNSTGMGMTREEMDAYNEGIDAMYSRVQGAPTIIEADKGGKK